MRKGRMSGGIGSEMEMLRYGATPMQTLCQFMRAVYVKHARCHSLDIIIL